jgi:predicted MFS family arabinose efflux permease
MPLSLLAAAGFLSSAGARVIDPLLHVISTEFSTTVASVSIVVAAFTLPYGLCQVLLGPLGDRFGKLRVVLTGLCAYTVAIGACALASNLTTLTLLRAGAGVASAGLIPVCLAYIGDAVPYQDRQVTLSRFLTGAVLAQTLAGPLGGVFGDYIGWRGVFLLLSGLAFTVAIAFGWRMRGLPDPADRTRGYDLTRYVALLRTPTARRILLGAFLDGAVLVGCFPFLAPYIRERFALSYSGIGLLLACFGLGALFYTRIARRMIPWLGESRMVLCGGLVMAAALVLALATPWWPAFVAVQLALGLGFFMIHGVMQARATELLPNARATAVSAFSCALFVGQAFGARGMGALIGAVDYRGAFAIQSVAVVAVGVWISRVMRRRPA